MTTIVLTDLRIDGGTQPRVSTNEAAIAEYVEFIRGGGDLPAITVFDDGVDKWLADGFHRLHAYRTAGAATIECNIIAGTKRDAILFSVGANAAHGLRRTNDDKRKAVQTLLNDSEWAAWADREIAKACGVSHPFVAAIRRPDVAAKQQENREKSVFKRVESDSNKPALESDSTLTNAPESVRASAPEAVMIDDPQDDIDQVSDLQDSLKSTLADNEMMGRVFDADDRLKAAMDEATRQKAIADNAERKFNAQQSKVQALASQVTYWKNRAEKAEKSLGKLAA